MKRGLLEGNAWSFVVERACFGLLGFGVWGSFGLGRVIGTPRAGAWEEGCFFFFLFTAWERDLASGGTASHLQAPCLPFCVVVGLFAQASRCIIPLAATAQPPACSQIQIWILELRFVLLMRLLCVSLPSDHVSC
jgi:hypothetical protein